MKDKPGRAAERQKKRRKQLKKLAKKLGFSSWSTVETKILNKKLEIIEKSKNSS